ncbi:biotin--[acetyl-CoA-carboxylase] ligase [Altererythrobacter salegens]|uniref:biotin--[biotin carboxyl-carrier protein] ligase n=1 Tax=Croceibacterium salegens TaxID=1737568 RepID=A0A6I4SUE8_9SPHN|nr:biotin--[acetyl-CoA-carboxylase] ligase [Croceibacterium salegens]MXO59585.1 biotin--[acetyl-CoA-carboxylase] ligase [Croceibacterium salegens]
MIRTVPETGSTNADLLARIAAGERIPEGDWLVADRQTSGRGRQGHVWFDGAGNFMGSTVVHLGAHDPAAPGLSFVAALAVYETVLPHIAQPHDLMLKWPNDVLARGAKLCGLLLEREGDSAVVGIGVNLVSAPQIEGVRTCSLADFGPAPSRDAFAADLAVSFDRELGRWRQFGLEPLLNRWRAAAHPPGTSLRVRGADGTAVSGTFDGLEPDGALRLRLEDGTIRPIHAGDVLLEG